MSHNHHRVGIVGIGSPHGDDQFGWAVLDQIESLLNPSLLDHSLGKHDPPNSPGIRSDDTIRFERISHPVDVLPTLDECRRVILIDAAVGLGGEQSFEKLDLADATNQSILQATSSHGTHDVGLHCVLGIAQSLGKRTDHVELWVGNAHSFDRMSPMTAEVALAATQCANAITRELCDARTVVG